MENTQYEKTGLFKQVSEWGALILSISLEIYGAIEKLHTNNKDSDMGNTNSLIGNIAIIVGILALGYFLFSIYQRLRTTEKYLIKSYENMKNIMENVDVNRADTLMVSYATAYTIYCHIVGIEVNKEARDQYIKTQMMSIAKRWQGKQVDEHLKRFFESEKA